MKPAGRVSVYSMALALVLGSFVFLSCGKLNFDPQLQTPFTPNSVGGLRFWLRADAGVGVSGMLVNEWVDQVSGVTFTPDGGAAGIPEFQPQSATMGGASTVKFGLSASGGQTMTANYTSGSYWCGANYTVVAIVRGQQENYSAKSAAYLKVVHTGAGVPYFFGSSRFSSSETPSGYKPTFIYSPPSASRVELVSNQQNAASAPMIAVFHAQTPGHNMSFNGVSGVQSQTQMIMSPTCADSGQLTIGITLPAPLTATASMEIAELMVYDWNVDAEQELKLGCYAAQKYGIPTFVGNCN